MQRPDAPAATGLRTFTTFREDVRWSRLLEVTERMRQQVLDAGSPVNVHEEDILEAARLVRALNDDA